MPAVQDWGLLRKIFTQSQLMCHMLKKDFKVLTPQPSSALLSQQKVKPARQKCSCASCQNRPNFSPENYGWVSTINENYQREVIAKMEEEKRVALAKRRAIIKMKKANKMNPPSSNNVTSSS